jgi:anti-sigma factor RsiW
MNERRFLELLNLYLDHQISNDEAVELETAVHGSPERRRTYEEYCKLQRACSELGTNARFAATSAPRLARSLEDVELKLTTKRKPYLLQPIYFGSFASLALAACVAVIMLANRPIPQVAPPSEVSKPIQVAAATSPVLPAVQPVVAARGPFGVHQAPLTMHIGKAVKSPEEEAEGEDPVLIAWMQHVDQLPKPMLRVDENAFAGRSISQPEGRFFRHHAAPTAAEFTGFELQR